MKFLQPVLALLILLSSCLPKEAKEEPVSKEEALAFSNKLDSSIRYKLPYYFNALINKKVFTERIAAASGSKVNGDIMKGVEDGLKKMDLGENIIKGVSDNGFYELVKQYEKDNKQHLLFRLYSNSGLNYHDFELTKRKGEVGIADMYIYLSGENMSKTLGDLLTSFSELKGDHDSEAFVQAKSVRKMKELYQSGEIEQAKEYYEQLSESIKKQKVIQIMNIQICSQIDQEAHTKAIENYQATYPDEANVNLLQLDYYISQRDYKSSMDAINKLDAMIDSDPFLDYIRALISNLMEEPAQSITYLEKLHKNMPEYGDGVIELIAHYLDNGEEDKANALIGEYKKNEKFDREKLDNYLSTRAELNND